MYARKQPLLLCVFCGAGTGIFVKIRLLLLNMVSSRPLIFTGLLLSMRPRPSDSSYFDVSLIVGNLKGNCNVIGSHRGKSQPLSGIFP